MGTPASITEFLSLVVQSNLLDSSTLDRYFVSNRESLPVDDPALLAATLVRDRLLTRFQAEQLLRGKWKGFFIDRYKVLGMLGEGGMGKVFLCEHPGMRRQVAIKVLPLKQSENPAVVEGFIREAQALASLDHRNIVHAFDVAEWSGMHYLVMEYVKGTTLDSLVTKEGPLSANRAIDYLRQSAQGLHHAFESGLVHRDIKPSNLLVAENGVLKILDLGLATYFHGSSDSQSENDNSAQFSDADSPHVRRISDSQSENDNSTVMGTVDYMAPEQALNSGTVDNRADIYSLGATFYFCLTGRSPFEGGTTAQKILWHQVREPEPLERVRPDLPTDLTAIIGKMMAKDPAHRFQNPDELLAALPILEGASLVGLSGPVLPPEDDQSFDVMMDTSAVPDQQKVAEVSSTRRVPGIALALVVLGAGGLGLGVYIANSSKPKVEVTKIDPSVPKPLEQKPQPNPQPNPAPVQPTPVHVTPQLVYLSELPEREVVVHGSIGKNGSLGFSKDKVVLNGRESLQSLATHPTQGGVAHLRYDLNGRYRTLSASATLNDTAKKTNSFLVFTVKGDGRTLWESKPIKSPADAQPFTIDVSGVQRLDLEIQCNGSNYGAHAVWAQPALQR